MSTRTKWVLFSMLGALGFGVGCAGTKEAGRDVGAAIPGVWQHREGVVVARDGNKLAVSDASKPTEPAAWFDLGPDTKIERDGQRVEPDQLSEGTPVRVAFEPATGAEKTNEVQVLTGQKAQEVEQKLQGQPSTPPPPENP